MSTEEPSQLLLDALEVGDEQLSWAICHLVERLQTHGVTFISLHKWQELPFKFPLGLTLGAPSHINRVG